MSEVVVVVDEAADLLLEAADCVHRKMKDRKARESSYLRKRSEFTLCPALPTFILGKCCEMDEWPIW